MASSHLKSSSRTAVAKDRNSAPDALRDLVLLLAVSSAREWVSGNDHTSSALEFCDDDDDTP